MALASGRQILSYRVFSFGDLILQPIFERERSLCAVARPSVCLSSVVCVSAVVCNVRAPYSGD